MANPVHYPVRLDSMGIPQDSQDCTANYEPCLGLPLEDQLIHAQADAARLRAMLERVTQGLSVTADILDLAPERTLVAEARALLGETK